VQPGANGAAGGNSVVHLLQAMLLLLHQHTQLGNLGVGCKFGLLESIGALLLLQQHCRYQITMQECEGQRELRYESQQLKALDLKLKDQSVCGNTFQWEALSAFCHSLPLDMNPHTV
jgi:hypothetical protein